MDRGSLLRDDRPVAVSSKGMLLLQALVSFAGAPVGKARLMEAAWPGIAVEESNLSVQIAALRKLLGTMEDGSDWILTVPRVGYRFAVLPRNEWRIDHRPDQHAISRPAIAVVPFTIGTDSRDKEYLSDGITDDIITALMRFRWFRVVSRGSSFAFKGRTADSREIARDLGARYLLEGSLRHSSDRLRVSAQFVDAETGGSSGQSATTCNWPTRSRFRMRSPSAWPARLNLNCSGWRHDWPPLATRAT
jgi:TolB-like protein